MSKQAELKIGSEDQLVNLFKGEKFADLSRHGQWTDSKDGRYLVPSYLSGSDYSGSLVTKSNHGVWCKNFESGLGVWWQDVVGGQGTYAIVIDLKGIPAEEESNVAEFLNGLQEYPLADEDHHSELQREAESEAWKDWAKRDFVKGIEKKFNIELDGVNEDLLFEIFIESSDHSNTYWENEWADSMYIDIDRIVKSVTKTDAEQLLKSCKS
jgi:hypothetical protein